MYVCVFIYLCLCVWVNILCICMSVCLSNCMWVCKLCVCMWLCVFLWVWVSICVCVLCVFECGCNCVYLCVLVWSLVSICVRLYLYICVCVYKLRECYFWTHFSLLKMNVNSKEFKLLKISTLIFCTTQSKSISISLSSQIIRVLFYQNENFYNTPLPPLSSVFFFMPNPCREL